MEIELRAFGVGRNHTTNSATTHWEVYDVLVP